MAELQRINIVGDRTDDVPCGSGFLQMRRLVLQNHYADGSTSRTYDCDIVSRRFPDAVAVVIYDVDDERTVRVAMRTGVRPPVYLRTQRDDLVLPETRDVRLLTEIVAGLLEPSDEGAAAVEKRAAEEAAEEAGYDISPDEVGPLGAPMYASPGITDEQVYYRRVQIDLDERGEPSGDGSVMEEAGEVVVLTLDEAIHRCRAGGIPDTKTELALLRLCDAIGYSVQLGCFLDTLPAETQPAPSRLTWLLGGEAGAGEA